MAKKAKSIVTLSFPICRKRRYAMLYFICPNTASGSMHRFPLCLTPSSEVNLSRAFLLYWFNRWFTSMMRFLRALKQPPRRGHPSHLCAWYRALSVIYPLAVLPRLVPMRGHVLSHGANVIIPFRIVMEALRMEWIGNITGTLLFMEEVVFDEGLYPVLPHEPVVFFRTITGIRHPCAGKPAIAFPE